MLISSFFCIESSSAFIRTSISIIVPAPEPSGVDTVLTEGMGLEIATGLAVYLQRFPLVSLLLRFESGWILMLLRWLFLGWRHFAHFLGDTKKTAFWSVLDGGSNPQNLAKGPRRHGLISQWWWTQPPMIILVLLRELPPSFGPKFLAGDVDVYQMDVIDSNLYWDAPTFRNIRDRFYTLAITYQRGNQHWGYSLV